MLDEQPVVGRQPVHDLAPFGPVGHLNPGRVHFRERLAGFGEFGGVGLAAGLHAGFTADAFADVDEGGEITAFSARRQRPASGHGAGRDSGGRSETAFQKHAS
jgi:hypothetical protein